jgi:WD40 repeat protein
VYETISGTLRCKIDRTGVDSPAEGVVSVKWIGPGRIAEIALVQTQREGENNTVLERAIIVWDGNTGERLATIPAPDAEVLSSNPSGKYIAEGGSSMRVRIHNLETGTVDKEFRTHDAPITDIQWHPKGRYIVTCSEDLTVRVSDFSRNMALVEELRGFERPPRRVFISPDNQKVAVASYRGSGEKVEIYDVEVFRVRNQ